MIIVEPKFEEIQKGFKVTIYKQKLSDVGVNEVYAFIKEYQPVKANKIAEHFDVSV